MEICNINLLGVPTASAGERQIRLRSKETWAVLASLIVPPLLRNEPYGPVARETLTNLFWSNCEAIDTSGHLRQCLRSIRTALGESCLISDRHEVQIASGWFKTDIEQALLYYTRGLAADSIDDRLYWLTRAEHEMRGEFIEGWTPDCPEAHACAGYT